MEVMDVFMAQIVVMVFQVFISKFIKLYTLRTYSFFMLITSVKWFLKKEKKGTVISFSEAALKT